MITEVHRGLRGCGYVLVCLVIWNREYTLSRRVCGLERVCVPGGERGSPSVFASAGTAGVNQHRKRKSDPQTPHNTNFLQLQIPWGDTAALSRARSGQTRFLAVLVLIWGPFPNPTLGGSQGLHPPVEMSSSPGLALQVPVRSWPLGLCHPKLTLPPPAPGS